MYTKTMLKRILIAGFLLASGCTMASVRVDPMAGLGAQNRQLLGLKTGIVISNNTKNFIKAFDKHATLGKRGHKGTELVRDFADNVGKSFSFVRGMTSIQEAAVAGVDLILVLDISGKAKVRLINARSEVSVSVLMMDPQQNLIDRIDITEEANTGRGFGLEDVYARYYRTALQNVAAQLASKIPGSQKLTAYAASLGGAPAAAGETRSSTAKRPTGPAIPAADLEVEAPGYRSEERPDDFAVVVGIDTYKDLPPAEFAERDAEAVRKHLVALGYPERQVVLLKGANATRTGLKKYLEEWLPRNVTPSSNVFFYYSGHGAPDARTGKAYLVPWDGDASFLKSTAYPIEQLYASLNRLKARQIVVALDACFSGAGGRSVLAEGARPLVVNVKKAAPRGRIVSFTAASANEITTTLKDHGHGIFTYYFLKGISGAAKDRTGNVTAKSLYRFLKPKVQREARLQNREQTPTVNYRTNVTIRPR